MKLLAIIKTTKFAFFRIFGANKGSFGLFRGSLVVFNVLVASLCAGNCIPTMKLLPISKTAKIRNFFIFSEQIRVVWGFSALDWGFPIF